MWYSHFNYGIEDGDIRHHKDKLDFKISHTCIVNFSSPEPKASCDQILSEASLGWGLIALGFGPGRIGTLVSMATDSSHRVIMGKMLCPL